MAISELILDNNGQQLPQVNEMASELGSGFTNVRKVFD